MSRQTTLHILRAAIGQLWTIALIVTILTFTVTGQTPTVEERERGSGEVHLGRDEGVLRHFRELSERLREVETIPVIVRLREDGRHSGGDELPGEITGYDAGSVKRFKYIPYLALRIDRSGLEQLRGSARVVDIQEDHAVHPGIVSRGRAVTGFESRMVGGGGNGRAIALIGGAIDRSHPELAGRLVAEGCYSTADGARGIGSLCVAEERTDCGVAGTSCEVETARALLAAGRESLAPRATLISLQIFSRVERGEGCPDGQAGCLIAFDSDVIRALERVYELRQQHQIGAVSLNLSNLRVADNCDESRSAMREALALLGRGGLTTVVAEERGAGGRTCGGGTISPAQLPGFGGEAAELAGLLVAGRETLAGSLADSPLAVELQRVLGSQTKQQANQPDQSQGQGAPDEVEPSPIDLAGQTARSAAIPATPTELLGTALSTSQIQLSWRDNSNNEGGFLIRRKRLNDASWISIATVQNDTTSYTDIGLFPGTTYLYAVSAINIAGESLRSNETLVELPIYNFRLYGTNGVTVNSSLHLNNHEYYRVSIPFGATQFLVQTVGSGDSDLYVRYGSVPGLFKFDCRSRLDSSSDRCVFSYPQAGDWYIMVYSNSRSVVNYTLEATFLTGIENNRPVGPTNLFATATSATQINLSWEDNATNEVGYSIRRRVGINGTPIEIATVSQNVTRFIDTGLSPDVTYYYSVIGYNLAGFSVSSNEANATTPGQLTARPIAPGGLLAVAGGPAAITLTWVDTSTNEAGFTIRRRAFLSNLWQVIGSVGPNVTTFQDTQVVPGTSYFYTITAINTAGESPLSNEAFAASGGGGSTTNVTLPPLNVQATAVNTGQVMLRWTDNSLTEYGFRVRRKEGENGPWILIAILDRNITSYLSENLSPGSTYYYTVSTFDQFGESIQSNEAVVTMPIIAFTSLENGVVIPHTVGRYRLRYYRIHVPIGASELLIQTKGIGSTEMYVRNGLQPTNFFHNCRSLSDTTNNRCYFLNPTPGDWHIMLTSSTQQGSTYQLTATYKMGVNNDILTPTGR